MYDDDDDYPNVKVNVNIKLTYVHVRRKAYSSEKCQENKPFCIATCRLKADFRVPQYFTSAIVFLGYTAFG